MLFHSDQEREMASLLTALNETNPFLPERIALERQVLGSAYKERGDVWHARKVRELNPNVARIGEEVETLTEILRKRIQEKCSLGKEDWRLYRDLIYYRLYYLYESRFYDTIVGTGRPYNRVDYYADFVGDYNRFLKQIPNPGPSFNPDHLFAFFSRYAGPSTTFSTSS